MTLDRATAHAAALYNATHAADIQPGTDFFAELVAGWQGANHLAADGGFGPITRAAVQAALAVVAPPAPAKSVWPAFDNPLIEFRPNTLAEVIHLFGDPSGGGKFREREKPDPAWRKKNVVDCHPSNAPKYPEILPQLRHRYWAVHKLYEPTAREGLHRVELVAPGYITKDGGTWAHVYRHKRDDPDMSISLHFALATDIEPERNKAHTFKPGKTPKPWSKEWMEIWPDGVTREIVDAMKSVGHEWGGDWIGYVDPMHFQACGSREQI